MPGGCQEVGWLLRYQNDPDWLHERVFRLANNHKQMGGTDGLWRSVR